MANNALIRQAIALLQQALGEPEVPVPGPIEPPVTAITSVSFQSLSDKPQETVPFTFGQVFRQGDFKPGSGLAGRFDNGDTIPLQVDVKALHADGSVRHAIISGIHSALFGKETRKMELVPAKKDERLAMVGPAMPDGKVEIVLDGVKYSTNAGIIENHKAWLVGADVDEVIARVKLTDAQGNGHPHLFARVAFRAYRTGQTRLDLTVENDWAYEPDPQNFTYDVLVQIGGAAIYEQKTLTHYHHARWRKVLWIGSEPQVHTMHDPKYLINTLAVANYDTLVKVSESKLKAVANMLTGERVQLMNAGSAMRYMPNTGGREDIGLLPGWAVRYLLSQDIRAKSEMLITADLAGSWSAHYRDQKTDQPISIVDYPYMTVLGRSTDTMNPKTKKYEAFPELPKDAKGKLLPHGQTPLDHDSSHQPNFAYLPYLVTGDYYYLEELQFWAQWNMFSMNPNYREREKGLVWRTQVRGQAWNLRSIAEAAYITPDSDRMKSHFISFVEANLDWYNKTYTDNPNANKLGVLDNPGAFAYQGGNGIAPWQDDFFTQVVGHTADLGFKKAEKLLTWKGKFAIERMVGEGAKPVFGAAYSMVVRPGGDKPLLSTIAQVLDATPEVSKLTGLEDIAKAVKLKVGEMTGYSSSAMGYPSNMQPALAYAADYLGERGRQAWKVFTQNPVKPDYSGDPEFAIVPRQ